MPDRSRGQIVGDGLTLRPPRAADRQRWLELYQDPDELRYGVPSFVSVPASLEQLDQRIEAAHEAWRAHEPATLTIVEQDDDTFRGTVAWRFDSQQLGIADIGYAVHPDSRGRGIASRAVRALTRWLTLDHGGPLLPRVQLDHSVENIASCRTALAAGYDKEGVRRCYLPLRDDAAPSGERRHDVCLHGFVAENDR